MIKGFFIQLFRKLGFVPKTEMDKAEKRHKEVEDALRSQSQTLETAQAVRTFYLKEVELLREIVLRHTSSESSIKDCVARMETAVGTLESMMKEQWPHIEFNSTEESQQLAAIG